MKERDVFDQLKDHYDSVAEELRGAARQAGLLSNATGIGTEREEVYRAFLERHVPKVCDVFLGGYIFDLKGHRSNQIDVIVTGGNTPRFRLSAGDRYIAPLEGTVAVAEIKSKLDKNTLYEALHNSASIPPMPDQKGIATPLLRLATEEWEDWPFKIVFAFDGIDEWTLHSHIASFYTANPNIPIGRRPNVVHVLGKYMIMRIKPGWTVTSDGRPEVIQPEVGNYWPFHLGADASAMVLTLNDLQSKAFVSNHLMYKYNDWHTKIMERIQQEQA